ncbi:transposase [Spongiactinospora rosea]|uniref:transposase n=1 Tax=Spongiactinospora rosea TaxID=2248750 RepID=UPI001CEC4DB6
MCGTSTSVRRGLAGGAGNGTGQWSRRQLIDGTRWRVRTGAPWRDVPACYGHWSTVYGLFRRRQRAGRRAQILAALQACADAAGKIGWTVSVDHRRAKGSKGGRPPAFDPAIYRLRHAVVRCLGDQPVASPMP